MTTKRPSIDVAVVMRKEKVLGRASRWQTWRWVLSEVLTGEVASGGLPPGTAAGDIGPAAPRLLYDNDTGQSWLHTGFKAELFKDDAEGYYLNVTTGAPCWFVFWRMEHEAQYGDDPIAMPQVVTLSYHDAGRWLDAQEIVEQVPAAADIVEWVRAFVDEHHVVEQKRRKRPESFKALTDRFGNVATVSTEKKYGGGGGSGGGGGEPGAGA